MAEIYDKGPGEKTLILGTREYFIYPFQVSPDWTDLRAGAFLSITDVSNDDLPNGAFAETITGQIAGGPIPAQRFWIGVKTKDTPLPTAQTTGFCGFTNAWFGINRDQGDSLLVSSDAGLGTTNNNFWRPCNSRSNTWTAGMWDAWINRAHASFALPVHFPQDVVAAGGYAVFLGLQLTRSQPTSKVITMSIKNTGGNADMLYTNTPSSDLVHTTLSDWPTGLTQLGPVQINRMPQALYFYWPFHKTRLRIHACGVLKEA